MSITNSKINYQDLIVIAVMSVFFFIGLGHVHLFDWDEINFAESAREMIESGNYLSVQINYQPFWEKPPLFFWMQVFAMKIFGINEFAARFPNAVFGIIYIMTLYHIGKREMFGTSFYRIWILLLVGSILPHIYFKSGIIDPVFNYFIFISVYCAYRTFQNKKTSFRYPFFSGIFSGLSFLTKGPVGFLLLFGTVFMVTFIVLFIDTDKPFFQKIKVGWSRFIDVISSALFWKPILMFTVGFTSLIAIWVGAEIYYHGLDILMKFVNYQIELFTQPVATHGQPFYYHFLVVFLGCFPASVFALPIIVKFIDKTHPPLFIWMISLFWVVMIIFSISTTKIVHYSSMTYIPLTYIAALYLHQHLEKQEQIKKYVFFLFAALGVLWSVILFAVPYLLTHTAVIIPYLKDQVAVDALSMPSSMTGYEPIAGIMFFSGIVISGYFMLKRRFVVTLWVTWFNIAVTLLFFNFYILLDIERLSQGPSIQFYKTLVNKDVYIEPVGYRSYAHYFYGKTKPKTNPKSHNIDWLMNGDIDKDVYFVTKSDNKELENHPEIQKIKTEGSFSFYIRKK